MKRVFRWLFPWRWVGLVVISLWVGVLYKMVVKADDVGGEDIEELYPWVIQRTLSSTEEWMGIYYRGQKVGYARYITERLSKGYLFQTNYVFSFRLFRAYQRVEMFSKVWTNDKFSIKKFEFNLDSPVASFQAFGKVRGLKLVVRWKMGKRSGFLQLPYRPAIFLSAVRFYLASQKFKAGKKFKVVIFDPQKRAYSELLIRVAGREKISVGGKTFDALKVVQEFRDYRIVTWLDEKGGIIREKSFFGLELLREDMARALKGITPSGELIRAVRIPLISDRKLPSFRDLELVRLRLEGPSLKTFSSLLGFRQNYKGGGILEISLERDFQKFLQRERLDLAQKLSQKISQINSEKSGANPSNLPSRRPTTAKSSKGAKKSNSSDSSGASNSVNSSLLDPLMVEILKEVFPEKRLYSRLEVLERLTGWLKEQRALPEDKRAEKFQQLLKRWKGGFEYSVLFYRLVSILGLNCPVYSGIFFRWREGSYLFHSWNICQFAGGRFLSVDPAYGQLPADLGHIVFLKGSLFENLSLFQLLRGLRVHLLNYR